MRILGIEYLFLIGMLIKFCMSTSWQTLIRQKRQNIGSAMIRINTPTTRTIISAALPSSGFVRIQITTSAPGVRQVGFTNPPRRVTIPPTTTAPSDNSQDSGRIALYVILPIIAVALVIVAVYLAWRLRRNKGQEIGINKNDVVLTANG